MRILVLGASGMAGHVIATYLEERGHTVTTLAGRNKFRNDTFILDASDKTALLDFLTEHQFDVVVNAIGVLVKASEDQKDLSVYLNGYLPHLLEKHYSNTSTKLIHLSTDCVFSGKNAPYKEDSFQDGELFYDKTKAIGEVINEKDLTFRMSIIGPDMIKEGIGLFNWFYSQTGTISGYSKVMWNGITTIELAKGIEAAISQKITGLYHLVPQKNISKYALLNLFQQTFNREDLHINEESSTVSDKTLLNTRTDFSFKVADYPAMIQEMREWIASHQDLYEHYGEVL